MILPPKKYNFNDITMLVESTEIGKIKSWTLSDKQYREIYCC